MSDEYIHIDAFGCPIDVPEGYRVVYAVCYTAHIAYVTSPNKFETREPAEATAKLYRSWGFTAKVDAEFHPVGG